MNYDDVIQMTTQGLALVLLISLPITAVSAVVGLLVSLVSAGPVNCGAPPSAAGIDRHTGPPPALCRQLPQPGTGLASWMGMLCIAVPMPA